MAPHNYQDIVLSLSHSNKVGTIKLNRPKSLNAFGGNLMLDIIAGLRELNEHPETVFTVITGEGRFFSAGADVKATGRDSANSGSLSDAQKKLDHMGRFVFAVEMLRSMIDHKKVLVVALNGPAVGGGAAWFPGVADILLASDSAWLQVPFSALGLVPEFGSAINFAQSIGVHRANEFLMMGRKLTAQELETAGLVNQIFPTSSFQQDVAKYLEEKLQINDGKSMMEAKRLMNAPLRDGRMIAVQNAMDALSERFVEGAPYERFALKKKEMEEKTRTTIMGRLLDKISHCGKGITLRKRDNGIVPPVDASGRRAAISEEKPVVAQRNSSESIKSADAAFLLAHDLEDCRDGSIKQPTRKKSQYSIQDDGSSTRESTSFQTQTPIQQERSTERASNPIEPVATTPQVEQVALQEGLADAIFVQAFSKPRKKRHWLRDKILSTSIAECITPCCVKPQGKTKKQSYLRKCIQSFRPTKKDPQTTSTSTISTESSHSSTPSPPPRLRKVAFAPEATIQPFDIHASSSQCLRPTKESSPLHNKTTTHQYRSSHAHAGRSGRSSRGDTLQIEFRSASSALTHVRKEAMPGLLVRAGSVPNITALKHGVVIIVPNGPRERKPDFIRFRLMKLDPATEELCDYSEEFTRLGGLKKWMRFDTPTVSPKAPTKAECRRWSGLASTTSCPCRSSAEEDAEPQLMGLEVEGDQADAAKEGSVWRTLLVPLSRAQDDEDPGPTGEEIRKALEARQVRPVVEMLWTDDFGRRTKTVSSEQRLPVIRDPQAGFYSRKADRKAALARGETIRRPW
ncbi:Enoyl-CoA delta isomerase 2, mitochondrial [Cyphellophora attinorum]|uniref:Enoyl-CoA delta isomerase 2, mitochondrial n=1 Tax=Cyphellophora attinorum TaxID=1664694 RepID=A0A0N0NHW9_9EURO|nr:Enoyl-CoA delta isomerase 2, mitochondrial [Phialophora attinorum]KPI35161.1 Enoyl-CoA delta isomerase 2, mitochondrial [Phialophora attinorum]